MALAAGTTLRKKRRLAPNRTHFSFVAPPSAGSLRTVPCSSRLKAALQTSNTDMSTAIGPTVGRMLMLSALTAVMLASAPDAVAHPISVTETNIFVTQSSARARIQLFAEDLLLFHQLEPNGDGIVPPDELKRGLEAHRSFLTRKVTLRDSHGELIPSQVTDIVPFEIPEDGIPEEDLMLYQATYELEYTFESPPEFLTFRQDITDDNFIIPSEMKLAIHQTGTANVIAGTLQPGAAVTHRFDWEDLLAPDASDAEYESWLEKQRTDTLGITSYSSVYSFIYVDPGEVRHEVLIPLATLETILPIQRADPAFLDVSEQDAVRTLIREWLQDENPAKINGVATPPEFSSIDFYGLSLRDFAQKKDAQRVSLGSGRVGIILRYVPQDDFVRDVRLTWNRFHSSIRKIRSVVMPWSGDVAKFEFSRFKKPDDNVFLWTADSAAVPAPVETVPCILPEQPRLRIPVLSCGLAVCALLIWVLSKGRRLPTLLCTLLAAACWPVAGTTISHPFQSAPPIEPATATRIVQQLHRGTYRALDHGTEQRIYESLERTVDGNLLESLYLQLREGLAVREQGGAVARVQSVEYVDGALNSSQYDTAARGSSPVRSNTGATFTSVATSFRLFCALNRMKDSGRSHPCRSMIK